MPPDVAFGLRGVHMEAATDGLVVTLDIEHRYENGSAGPIEVVYTFPVPHDAVILGVEAEREGQPLAVALHEAGIAEDVYEAAQAEHGFAALVERRTPGLCTASLGALLPGTEARLRVRLGRFLEVAGGVARIVAPSLATIPEGSRRGAAAGPLGAPSASLLADYPLTFRLTLLGGAALAEAASPTHALERSSFGEGAVLSLEGPAALDRDVVVTLAGLPAEDGGWIAYAGARLAVAATTPPVADERGPMDAVVLIDAAGPLRPLVRDMSEILELLASEWEPGDRLSVARFGRTLSPDPPATVGPDSFDVAALGSGAADLGDIPPGASPPDLPPGADLCLFTDGRTRVSEWLAERAAAEGRRLFVLGVGSAPDAGWLHPAALATGGDYVGLSPGEALEPAAHRLLGALTLPPVWRPPARWSGAPVWSDQPAVWRSGLRGVACAAFEGDAPETLTLAFEPGRPAMRLPPLATRDALAQATARIAAARRLSTLHRKAQADWARRFALPCGDAAWIAEAPGLEIEHTGEPRVVTSAQMVAAGWRGGGRLTPVPPPPEAPRSPPPRPEPRLGGARKPSPLWIAAAAMVALVSAAIGVWGALRAPPAPLVAVSERFPSVTARTGPPIREAVAMNPQANSPGAAPGARPTGLLAGLIAALLAAALALAVWLRGRRRRRGLSVSPSSTERRRRPATDR